MTTNRSELLGFSGSWRAEILALVPRATVWLLTTWQLLFIPFTKE